MDAYRVKGSTIRTKLEWVQSNYGEKEREILERDLSELATVAPPYLDSSWYPFDDYVKVCELIAEKYFSNNLSKLSILGEDSAEKALTTVYKSFTDESFRLFLERIPGLHKMFYNRGHIEIELKEDEKKCFIHHRNKDRYAEADLYIALGFYKKAAEIHGCINPTCYFAISEGHAIFTLKWK